MVMMAIERIGAPLTAQAGTIGPLSTILLAVLLLGEPFTAWWRPVLCWWLPGFGCSRGRRSRRGSRRKRFRNAVRSHRAPQLRSDP